VQHDLKGRVALVTGASRGLGEAIAEGLARCGAMTAVNYFANAEKAGKVVRNIQASGGRAEAFEADVRDEQQVADLVVEDQRQARQAQQQHEDRAHEAAPLVHPGPGLDFSAVHRHGGIVPEARRGDGHAIVQVMGEALPGAVAVLDRREHGIDRDRSDRLPLTLILFSGDIASTAAHL